MNLLLLIHTSYRLFAAKTSASAQVYKDKQISFFWSFFVCRLYSLQLTIVKHVCNINITKLESEWEYLWLKIKEAKFNFPKTTKIRKLTFCGLTELSNDHLPASHHYHNLNYTVCHVIHDDYSKWAKDEINNWKGWIVITIIFF